MDQHLENPEMQQDMQFSEDDLTSSESEEAVPEVTCTDYLKHLEEENACQDSATRTNICIPGSAHTSSLNVDAQPFLSNTSVHDDSYMRKVFPKRDRPGKLLNIESGY